MTGPTPPRHLARGAAPGLTRSRVLLASFLALLGLGTSDALPVDACLLCVGLWLCAACFVAAAVAITLRPGTRRPAAGDR